MKRTEPYLIFDGNCRQAMNKLTNGDLVLMASDTMPGMPLQR
jgi:uncharacterized glyoxalase superfamily protein PhnB